MNKTVIPNSNIEIAAGGGEHTVTAGTPVSLPAVIADQLVSLGLATYAPATSSTGTTTSATGTVSLPTGAFLDGYNIVNGAVVFTASDGSTLAPLALSGAALTAAQTAQISGALQAAQVLDQAGHIALPVDGALDSGTVGGMTAGALKAEADKAASDNTSQAGSLSALGAGVTTAQNAASSASTIALSAVSGFSSSNGTITLLDHNGNPHGAFATGGASAAYNGVLDAGTVTRTGGAAVSSTARVNRVYHIDDFAGAQVNTSGSMAVFDDAAASAMWTQILADAARCTNVAAGFTASIVFGAHQYNWQHPVNFVVPGNGSSSNPGSSLPVELHLTVEWNSSVHYTFGPAGFCFSPYTMDGRYDDLFSRKQFNNRYQGVSAYAIKKTATAGVGSLAFAALGSTNEIAGGGVSTFRFGQLDCYDANTGGYYLSYLDVSGVFFAQVDGPAGTSSPAPTATSSSCVNPGTSALRLGGFNIQFWLKNLLPNYVEAAMRVVGYIEAFLTQNYGGVNCDYDLWCDVQGTDWTGMYTGQFAYGLQWAFDDQSEMDAYKWCFDISTVNMVFFYGGTFYQHAVGGNAPSDGVATGDTANTGGIILRGCTEMKCHDGHFRGPAVNPEGPGATCANGGRGLTVTTQTFNGLQNKPNGPANGSFAYGSHGTFDGNDFLGFGAGGTVSPVLFDAGCINLTSMGSRFFFAPSNQHDGYCARYPVQDADGRNQGFDFVGTADGAFTTTTRALR